MDRPAAETHAVSGNHAAQSDNRPGDAPQPGTRDVALLRTIAFIAVAAASAAIAYALVRATLSRGPADPTTERIQSLIDEANRLLKQLDEKKPS